MGVDKGALEKLRNLDFKWKVGFLALIVLFIWQTIRTISYRTECYQLKEDAVAAYENNDYIKAASLFNQFTDANSKLRTIFFWSCPNYTSGDFELREEYDNAAWQITELESAIRDQNSGEYFQAIFILERLIQHYPNGINADESKNRLKETYQLLSQDTGEAGRNMLQNLYDTNCGISEYEVPDEFSDIILNTQPKYWYPLADPTQSNNIARIPAEFRVAVCYELTQTTDIIESCYYGNSNSVGAFETAINRMSAIYKIRLVDTITSIMIAELDGIKSTTAGECPASINYNSAGIAQPIIGMPDFSLISPAWLEEQLNLAR